MSATLVQYKYLHSPDGTLYPTVDVVFDNPVTPGNFLALFAVYDLPATSLAVVGGGTSWTRIVGDTVPNKGELSLWVGYNADGSSSTVNVDPSTNYAGADFMILEFSGMPTSDSLDSYASQVRGQKPATTGPTTTTAGLDALILAGGALQSVPGGTEISAIEAGFTAPSQPYAYWAPAYQIAPSTATSYSYSVTVPGFGSGNSYINFYGLVAVFEAATVMPPLQYRTTIKGICHGIAR